MRSTQVLFTVFAGVFSLVVVVGSLMGRRVTEPLPMQTAVVVNRDLDIGTTLSAEMLSTIPFPAMHLPPGVGTDPSNFSGRVLSRSMRHNQLLYPEDLADGDSPLTLQSKISQGNRGYTISLNTPSSGLAGFVLPGSRVDVLSTPTALRGQEVRESSTVVENVLVLAVDNISIPEDVPANPKTMTLLLSPEQTRRVDLAQAHGPLRLSLRNNRDLTVSATSDADMATRSLPTSTEHEVIPVSQPLVPEYQASTSLRVLVLRESIAYSSPVRVVRKRPSKPPRTVLQMPPLSVPSP